MDDERFIPSRRPIFTIYDDVGTSLSTIWSRMFSEITTEPALLDALTNAVQKNETVASAWMTKTLSKAIGIDAAGGYDPDRPHRKRLEPAFFLAALDEHLPTYTDAELDEVMAIYDDRSSQTEAKIRVACKREARRRRVAAETLEAERRQAELERLQDENPSFGMF